MNFAAAIAKFNAMYRLPLPEGSPTLHAVGDPVARLESFKRTLLKEVDEVDAILENLRNSSYKDEFDALTDIADWLTDVQVFAASEMLKFGLPIERTSNIVMSSNFSKRQADGSTLYDADGKVQKGPGYWKPEPKIKEMLLRTKNRYEES